MKTYYSEHKESIIEYNKKRYWDNRKEKLQYQKDRYYIKREQLIEYQKKYCQENKPPTKKRIKHPYETYKGYGTYKERHNAASLRYNKKNYYTNIHFRLLNVLRLRIWETLKHNRKSKRTMELVGCSVEELKQHLEQQFKDCMDWSNYGTWHIDHIKPCCKFDLSKPEEQKECFHYNNLQPLWAKDNMSKGGR